ncbi:hypothetical protein [Jiella pelagia]|uniref:BlaI/MecI/CopY family transcriptional regulator n=1 Tax=Jiella pelagia TaxID=2986949 RepID=A0ABY7BW10_9HYPH|nr:hypothetical protein [Jiella pelagia]WAP68017.1 hypothetical protein OH818_21795 [Jiella pelagia]
MANARDQMKMLESELERVRSEIEKLRVEEALLIKMLGRMGAAPAPAKQTRTRSPNVKPLVLDIMRDAAQFGATTSEVESAVRDQIPSVAKDTVGSVLSRLKSDGALEYVGDRYYEKRHSPKQVGTISTARLQAVN